MIRSESLTIFWVSELESFTIFSPSTYLFTISDLLEETIFSERLYFFIALAKDDPIRPHPIIHTLLNII